MKLKDNLILGDCLEILPKIPNKTFNLIIIDPPYNAKQDFPNDKMVEEEYLLLFEDWIKKISYKLKDDGTFFCFINEKYLFKVKPIIDKYLIFRRIVVWYYEPSYRGFSNNFSLRTEFILFYSKSENYTFNILREKISNSTYKRWKNYVNTEGFVPYDKLSPSHKKRYKRENYERNPKRIDRGAYLGNVLQVNRISASSHEYKFGRHPTQKPEELLEKIIEVCSDEGNLIGDFFMGSGTTLVVAKKLRRKYFGCEIEPKYYEIAKRRLKSVMFTERKIWDYFK